MLRNTFLHIPGVGRTTERALWEKGFSSWDILLERLQEAPLGTADVEDTRTTLEASTLALNEMRHQFFAPVLGIGEAWRAWPEFRKSCVYLDIETDGGQSGESITMVGLYDGESFRALTKGEDLAEFPDIISHYSMIVTFFGSGFDIPMLQKKFRNVPFDHIHLDLCPTLKKLGYRGGLKNIEKQLGIARVEDAQGLTGLDAVRLWREYIRGNESSLETLIAYNREDVVNLERLAEFTYRKLKANTFDNVAATLPLL
ncbi:MAG: ribonuclease H-like domain-containing protein [Fimbriimonadaceae bacterium]|nr:ribonuclease H-like domain-containing protein [Fimbriimonadaceae bacterium]